MGVLFGGRSGEHDVSISSAQSLVEAVDTEKYEVVLIHITRSGGWLIDTAPSLLASPSGLEARMESTELVVDVSGRGLVSVENNHVSPGGSAIDVVFPLLHGPFGEDGTVQGMLELANIPYVGAGVAASAIGLDKAFMKAIFEHAGLPVARYQVITLPHWKNKSDECVHRILSSLGLPVFVKPARLGSSVGINKAKTEEELRTGLREAFMHDGKAIIEEEIQGREIECGILGNLEPEISVFGEILASREFYDYSAKYTDGLAELVIPANLSPDQISGLTDLALRAFGCIDAEGMARVDFFIENESGRLIVNEINTIPGFAPTSMFPKLWAASGVSYADLIDRLVQLAIDRHANRTSSHGTRPEDIG